MRSTWRTEAPQLLVVAGILVWMLVAMSGAPAQVPTRFDFAGRPTAYGPRETLLIVPGLALGIYLLFLVLPRIDPLRANYARFATEYAVIRWTVLLFLAGIALLLGSAARGTALDAPGLIPIGVGLLFGVLGAVMRRLRPNWFIGIRTPWTLSSERSWRLTHRLGGWVFMVIGLAFVASGLLRSAVGLIAAVAIAVAGTLLLTVYSYLAWRDDPARSGA